MFVCEDCLRDYTISVNIQLVPLSRGSCEDCHKVTVCYDLPHNSYYHKNSEYARRRRILGKELLRKQLNPSRRTEK